MKRIVVTGAGPRGFLGYHVRKSFNLAKSDMYNIVYTGSEYNLIKQEDTNKLFIDLQPDILIHMAAQCGGILANKNTPADFLRDNTQMGLNVYEAARQFVCERVYTLGSVCAYGKYCTVPFKEDNLFVGYPEETNAPYGQAKRTLLMLGQTYREQYGIGGAHLIPVNMYGEKDHFDLVNSHVIPALINKFTSGDKVVKCWGTGTATREFLYAGDAAEAIVQAVLIDLNTPLPINIGTGEDISIKDLSFLIAELVGFKGKIKFTNEVSDGQPERKLDVSRAKDMLGFVAKTDLRQGLIKTIKWYLDNRTS
ncbi:MAG: NAD-dependent epimerase/dehydratase family protein [bacterium]|nr:NAD-dependent epimerase/dehydratase family protein [bacterium]